MGEGEALLDKRPVRPRKKRRSKKKVSKKTPLKLKEELKQEAVEAMEEGLSPDIPEPIEEADPDQPEAVTFFSKYKMDEIVVKPSEIVQLSTNKYVTLPARVARFSDHKFTTEDPEVIDYIRNPRGVYEKFDRFGVEVFEVGREDHKAAIFRLSDEGIAEYLIELHMKARRCAKHEGFAYETSV